MNKKHLLWWVFDWIDRCQPEGIDAEVMANIIVGDDDNAWVKEAMQEKLIAYKESLKKT